MRNEVFKNEQVFKDLENRFVYAIRDNENKEFNVSPNNGKCFIASEIRFLVRYCNVYNLTFVIYYNEFTKQVESAIY